MSEPAKRTTASRISKRVALADSMRFSGATALLLRRASWRGVLVLSYHRIGDVRRLDTSHDVWTASAETLDRQLALVARHCEIIAPAELTPQLVAQRGRRVLVTFDDGYRDLYELAFPVLQANGVRAAMFLCSGLLDGVASAWWDEIAWMLRHSTLPALAPGPWAEQQLALGDEHVERAIDVVTKRYWQLPPGRGRELIEQLGAATGSGRRPAALEDWMTWDMAREMHAAGHRAGAHTVTHPILARLGAERQREEIASSMARIEAELGERPTWLAYPVGLPDTFDEQTAAAAAAAGIELAFTNYGGLASGAGFRAHDVRRASVERMRRPSIFSATLALPALFAR